MTHAFLQSELTSLISDSKRKNSDVRTAAEQSLSDIKSISVTSETQFAGDLNRKPHFIEPFILACRTKNTKLATTGTACLHRLTASKAIPRARLPDVLIAFQDAVGAGYDPQLKTLQTLPSLLQLYADDIHGQILAKVLELCAVLQSSKTAVVSNTAAATFQQLISTVFESPGSQNNVRTSSDSDHQHSNEQNGQTTAPEDGMRLFEDFCLLLDQQQPQFLAVDSLPPAFLLETLHTILSTHDSFLASQGHYNTNWATHLVQGLARCLIRRDNFGITARALLILLMVLRNHAADLRYQVAQILPILSGALDRDGNPSWRRALFLEFFRRLCSEFSIVRLMFTLFDTGTKPVGFIGQLMSSLVRIASEDPSLIGLGRQSTIPVHNMADARSEEAAAIEAQGLGGAITSVTSNDANAMGISAEWSLIPVQLLDQPDKTTAPATPSTYIYTLVLGCVAALCDGLSKFIMPLSVPSRSAQRDASDTARRDSSATDRGEAAMNRRSTGPASSSQKYQRLVNPLKLPSHRSSAQIQTSADIIETCWPALLAACSTFLNSAVDTEYYHTLIRSIQKLTQVSGVLELSTPRDALLTTLAKASVPANVGSIGTASHDAKSGRVVSADHSNLKDGLKSPTETSATPITHPSTFSLNTRHLLCLRALLNLGIALGPTLERDAWLILIETMQTVENLIAMPNTTAVLSQSESPRIGTLGNDGQSSLATEIAAVQAATKRLLESTRMFNGLAFAEVVRSLLQLLGQDDEDILQTLDTATTATPGTPTRLNTPRSGHRASRSISGRWNNSKTLDFEVGFVLNKISELCRLNIYRFGLPEEQFHTWTLIGGRLLRVSQSYTISGHHRIQAASILDLIVIETVKLLDSSQSEVEDADVIRSRCLNVLLQQINSLAGRQDSVELEIHERLLDALESMISHSGDSLTSCWPAALEILSSTYLKRRLGHIPHQDTVADQAEDDIHNVQILQTAFKSIQLITSDFLGVLDPVSLAKLAHLLRQFGLQHYDLNVALTSTTVLWNVASHVLSRVDYIDVEDMPRLQRDDEQATAPSNTDSTTVWSIILLELIQLCKDGRPNVRNAAIRVLLKVFDASSESLSSSTWAITLREGLLNTIRYYISRTSPREADDSAWMLSAGQLTAGYIQLMCHNLRVIASDGDFMGTWLYMLMVFEEVLDTMSLSASSLVFTSLSKVVSALPELGHPNDNLIQPVVKLWMAFQPAQLQQKLESTNEHSNQEAITMHAHLLVVTYKTSPTAVAECLHNQTHVLMVSIEHGIMLCTHPPYTSDLKSLAPEQKEACECLAILKTLLNQDVSQYAAYLIRLLNLTLDVQLGQVTVQQKRSAMSKTVQKPTFIAITAACLDRFRNLILEHAEDEGFIWSVAASDACSTLSATIGTKYTKLPLNSQAPLWRNATITAVVLLEALQKHVNGSTAPQPIISIAASILQAGGLTNPPSSEHNMDAVHEDETFDVEHFQLVHKAIVPIFECADEVQQDACKQYAMLLFRTSLLAKPWFYDFPDDLENEPLKRLEQVRPGSVHRPVFAIRRQICYAALDALFGLVRQPQQDEPSSHPAQASSSNKLARAAAPYLILRVVHSLKTLLADQRLRSLSPPPMPQQIELQMMLSKFVDLRSDDHAMQEMVHALRAQNKSSIQTGPNINVHLSNITSGDGKTHLRVLYSMMLRVQKFWLGLPRLTGLGARAWQDDEPGREIPKALERWHEVIAEGWGI